ncbi:MAG: hypothetical protein WA949_16705 [Phormidesmis sp.]
MNKEKESTGLVIESNNSPETEDSLSPQIQEVLDSIDELVKAKRMQQRSNGKDIADEGITHKERADIIKMYCKLEKIREKRKGRFLMEYDNGLETVVQEFRNFAV